MTIGVIRASCCGCASANMLLREWDHCLLLHSYLCYCLSLALFFLPSRTGRMRGLDYMNLAMCYGIFTDGNVIRRDATFVFHKVIFLLWCNKIQANRLRVHGHELNIENLRPCTRILKIKDVVSVSRTVFFINIEPKSRKYQFSVPQRLQNVPTVAKRSQLVGWLKCFEV